MENIVLSKRLLAAAKMIAEHSVVADIGTDHGYLPIYLIQSRKTDRVIAMDVRKKPLEKAKGNAVAYGVSDNIDLRLSDGLEKLSQDEAETITICGMGGKLISAILENGKDKIGSNTDLILSPQSEIPPFREYLFNNGYITIMEDMIFEDGKYYVIIKCRLNGSTSSSMTKAVSEDGRKVFFRYGRYLLEHKNTVLKDFICKDKETVDYLYEKVSTIPTGNAKERLEQLKKEREFIEEGLKYYDM